MPGRLFELRPHKRREALRAGVGVVLNVGVLLAGVPPVAQADFPVGRHSDVDVAPEVEPQPELFRRRTVGLAELRPRRVVGRVVDRGPGAPGERGIPGGLAAAVDSRMRQRDDLAPLLPGNGAPPPTPISLAEPSVR